MPETANPEKLNPLEVEHERKRARSLLRSPEGRQALRDVTGYNFVLAGEADEKRKPIVAVLTPSHGGFKPQTAEAFANMVRFSQPHCVIYPEPAVSASIVHWVRNDLVCRLYKSSKPFDFVLLMDDDMVPPPDALTKMLAHDVDIVGAACTIRTDPPTPNFRMWEPDTYCFRTAFEWNGEGLIDLKGGGVGTGFMLVKREALEKIADYYLTMQHEKRFLLSPFTVSPTGQLTFEAYDESRLPEWLRENLKKIEELRWKALETSHNPWWFEVLKQPNASGEFGEDLSFCFKARELGIPVHVDTTVRVGHIGAYAYSLDDYWDYQAGKLLEEKHRVMFCAATGRAIQAPKFEQPFVATKKISVLLPSRGRPLMVHNNVTSLLAKAHGDVEVLIRLDVDDIRHERYEHLANLPGVHIITGVRHGYRKLNVYCNELAEKATGDWLMLWNDDAEMLTDGWDEHIHAAGGGLKVLNATGQLNLFPIFTRELYELLGYVSPQTHSDSWLQVVSRVNGIEHEVGIEIKHLRDELDDSTKRETQKVYEESTPEFFSAEWQTRLLADVEKVRAELNARAKQPEAVTA